MKDQRYEINEEDIGIRAFQMRKAKAVETAMARLRRGLGDSWEDLSAQKIEELGWTLGELWAYVAHGEWDHLHFGLLTFSDVEKILELGGQMRGHTRPGVDSLDEVGAIVRSKG